MNGQPYLPQQLPPQITNSSSTLQHQQPQSTTVTKKRKDPNAPKAVSNAYMYVWQPYV